MPRTLFPSATYGLGATYQADPARDVFLCTDAEEAAQCATIIRNAGNKARRFERDVKVDGLRVTVYVVVRTRTHRDSERPPRAGR